MNALIKRDRSSERREIRCPKRDRKWSSEIADRVLDIVAKTGSPKRASELTGVSAATIHDHRRRDPEFGVKYIQAMDTAFHHILGRAFERSLDDEEPSDRLIEVLLKFRWPERLNGLLSMASESSTENESKPTRNSKNTQVEDRSIVSEKPTLGPMPSEWSAMVTRKLDGPGWTYSMRFGDRDVWKVGHTADVQVRLIELNRHVPHEILGERWQVFHAHEWQTPQLAFAMEQRVLTNLKTYRTVGERILCPEDELLKAWNASFQ